MVKKLSEITRPGDGAGVWTWASDCSSQPLNLTLPSLFLQNSSFARENLKTPQAHNLAHLFLLDCLHREGRVRIITDGRPGAS